MPLLSAQKEEPEVLPTSPQGDEKIVSIVKPEPEKKTRKLKKPSVVVPNEQSKEGIDEGPA